MILWTTLTNENHIWGLIYQLKIRLIIEDRECHVEDGDYKYSLHFSTEMASLILLKWRKSKMKMKRGGLREDGDILEQDLIFNQLKMFRLSMWYFLIWFLLFVTEHLQWAEVVRIHRRGGWRWLKVFRADPSPERGGVHAKKLWHSSQRDSRCFELKSRNEKCVHGFSEPHPIYRPPTWICHIYPWDSMAGWPFDQRENS